MQEIKSFELVVCPQNHARLQMADEALIEQINQAIAAGQLRNVSGRSVEKRLDSALVREDGRVVYPIVDEIPILLADEAICVDWFEPGKK